MQELRGLDFGLGEDIEALPQLMRIIAHEDARFIVFCDDLSFDKDETSYKSLKTILDGGLEGRPGNVLFYATSNRRHLMPRDMIENERATAITPGEAVEEKVSLSDRFGLWLGFHNCDQPTYLGMVRGYSGDGISFQQSNDVQVLDCVVEKCAGGGIHPGSGSQRAVIRGCTSRENDKDGFFFCWRVRGAVVEDNTFIGNGAVGISIGHKDSDNSIRRNVIADNAGGGVQWRGETEPMAAHNITFMGNTLRNNGSIGLYIGGETNGTVIRDNIIECAGANSVGIRIGSKAGEVVIENNQIHAEQEISDERQTQ